MASKRITSMVLVLMAISVLALFAQYVRIGATADSVAILKTSGMACGSCASKISQTLESVKGVAITEVDISSGWVIVGFERKTVSPVKLALIVEEIGYDSKVHDVVTPEKFRQVYGRDLGRSTPFDGCCRQKKGACRVNQPG